ncbi:16S rRNA (guanine1207-N2)-methyltransferase [Micrococcales bacterium KH10]|nr:16S rRNA (guanine1207-N2)-methyltransferase [Micrococcales bacterium KH10]
MGHTGIVPTPAIVVSDSLTAFCQDAGMRPDAVDRLLWDEFALVLEDLEATETAEDEDPPRWLAIVGDESGALTAGVDQLLQQRSDNWVAINWQDSFAGRSAVQRHCAPAHQSDRLVFATEPVAAFEDAEFVIGRLPKSLDALDELAGLIAAHARPSVTVLLTGRVKHMTTAMNDVLSRHFAEVQPHLGRQKSRTLEARGPRPTDSARPSYPLTAELDGPFPDGRIAIASHGGVFAGSRLDVGTRELLAHLDDALNPLRSAAHPRVLDLGCGTGLLATTAALLLPQASVIATDDSWAAVHSTVATARRNGLVATISQGLVDGPQPLDSSPGIQALWDDTAASIPDASIDLILCNPPFHQGAAVDTSIAWDFFATASRVLRPEGQMWTVFNRHLPYLPALRRQIGPTTVVHATPKFTIARSERA